MLNRLSVKSVQPSFYSSSRIDSILTPSDRTSIYLSFVHVILVLSFVFYILGSTEVLSFFSNNPLSNYFLLTASVYCYPSSSYIIFWLFMFKSVRPFSISVEFAIK